MGVKLQCEEREVVELRELKDGDLAVSHEPDHNHVTIFQRDGGKLICVQIYRWWNECFGPNRQIPACRVRILKPGDEIEVP